MGGEGRVGGLASTGTGAARVEAGSAQVLSTAKSNTRVPDRARATGAGGSSAEA